MQTDEQFGSNLGARMRSELNYVHAAPDLLPAVRRRLARRTRMVQITVVAPVVMVAAVALLIATLGQTQPRGTPGVAHGTSSPSGTSPTSNGPPPVDTAYVLNQTEQSLSRATDYVIVISLYIEGAHRGDIWLDPATHRYRDDVYQIAVPPPAPLIYAFTAQYDGHGNFRNLVSVDYRQKTYSFTTRLDGPGPQTGAIDLSDPNSIRNAVESGRMQVLAEETVDGHDTLHLRIQGPDPASLEFFDMWVDSTTFLPVEGRDYLHGPTTSDEGVVRSMYSWLPRTPDNLAHLTLTPPRGFRRT
jgi:hypothetical protein